MNCRHRQSERKHTGIYRIHLLITIYKSRCVCPARSENLARPDLLTYSYLLFYFILTWRSNYLILFLTLFIELKIFLFIFWVTTFVVMMRVVLYRSWCLWIGSIPSASYKGLVLKINFSFSKSFLLRCETWQVLIRNINNIIIFILS